MANVSADLVWQCTKNYNSFLVKRNGVTLTAEPGNPTNLHRASYSGLASNKSIDVRAAGDSVTLTLRKVKDQKKPAKALRVVKVKAADPNRVIRTARKLINDSFYRPAATNVVVKRIAKLAQANTRANKLSKGKLVVRYGRNAKPFPFADAKQAAAAPQNDDELPPLTTGNEAD